VRHDRRTKARRTIDSTKDLGRLVKSNRVFGRRESQRYASGVCMKHIFLLTTLSVMLMISSCSKSFEMEAENREVSLLFEIQKTPSGTSRDALIGELETTPEYMRTFFERWFFIHFDYSHYANCWSDEGFDPSKSKFSRNILIFAAADYGKSDIDNGGFHQFLSNPTGTYAPEVAEWFEQAKLYDAANIVREAIGVFGDEFPRSQLERQQFLERFKGETREQLDPFHRFDDKFYEATIDEKYESAANKWLRESCGIKNLKQGS